MNLQNQPRFNLMNLADTNTKVHNGGTVDGSYFTMGDVNNNAGSVGVIAPTGNNLVEINKLKSKAGAVTLFMGGGGLQNLRPVQVYLL